MFIKIGGRGNGKTYMLLCERASELQLQIEFAKKFDLPYEEQLQELKSIYYKLDGGNYGEEKQNKSNKQTSKQKNEDNSWRLF